MTPDPTTNHANALTPSEPKAGPLPDALRMALRRRRLARRTRAAGAAMVVFAAAGVFWLASSTPVTGPIEPATRLAAQAYEPIRLTMDDPMLAGLDAASPNSDVSVRRWTASALLTNDWNSDWPGEL